MRSTSSLLLNRHYSVTNAHLSVPDSRCNSTAPTKPSCQQAFAITRHTIVQLVAGSVALRRIRNRLASVQRPRQSKRSAPASGCDTAVAGSNTKYVSLVNYPRPISCKALAISPRRLQCLILETGQGSPGHRLPPFRSSSQIDRVDGSCRRLATALHPYRPKHCGDISAMP